MNNRPFDTVTMDLYGELPTTKEGYKYLLVIVDHFSKWPEAIPLKEKSTECIADAINNEFIARHSIPRKVLSDNDAPLIASSLNTMWKLYGTRRVTSSVEHPKTNTAAERFNRFLGDCIYAAIDSAKTDWQKSINTILMSYRMTTNPTTGESPYFLLHGTDPVLPDDIIFAIDEGNKDEIMNARDFAGKKFALMRQIFDNTKERLRHFAEKEKLKIDENRTAIENLTIGRRVMVFHTESHSRGDSTKFVSRYSGPYRVLREVDKGKTYHLWHPQTGKEWIVNVDAIRPFDTWENYELNRAERDVEFWSKWKESAIQGDQEDTKTEWNQRTREERVADMEKEEDGMRNEALRIYHDVINKGSKPRPSDEDIIGYAQNWSGEWVPYDTRRGNFELIRLLDRRQEEGQWQWLVQWKGDWLPTWEGIEIFEEAKTTGTGLVWLEYKRTHPYPPGTNRPTLKDVRRRKR